MGDMAAVKVLKNALCFIMGYVVAMETYVTLLLLMYLFAMYILCTGRILMKLCTEIPVHDALCVFLEMYDPMSLYYIDM